MEPDKEDVFNSLCDNNERLLKEMNVYLASISTTPDISIKATTGDVASYLLDSATGGETDDDSLVAMARQMDAASIISDPLEKDYCTHAPLSPRIEISAGMEEMLAQFTNSDPSIKKTKVQERFNSSDPFISRSSSTQYSPNVPPLRSSNPKQMKTYSPVSTYPISPSFDKYPSKTKRDDSPPTAKILPFPSFENIHQQRRLSLERLSDVEVGAANVLLQQEKKTTKSSSKYKETNRGKDDDLLLKRAIPPQSFSERESTVFNSTDANSLRKKGWHKKQPPNKDGDSDDEMCGVGINTRVHGEKKTKCKTSKEKRNHHLETRQHQHESKSTSNTPRWSNGKNSSRRGEEQSDKSKSHSEERRHHKTHRRMGTSQSRKNLDTERVQIRANSSSPKNSRRLSDRDNHSTYDSDDETQFFYESTDDDDGEEGEFESEDDMKAVGTSVVDAVKDLNERSAVAKVKNLFKLHY